MLFSSIGRLRTVKPNFLSYTKKQSYFKGPTPAPSDVPGLSGESGFKEFQSMGGDFFLPDTWINLRKKFGDIARLDFPAANSVIVFHPDDIQAVYNAEGKYPVGSAQVVLNTFVDISKQLGVAPNIINLTGHEWKTFRTKIQKDLTPPQVAQSYLPLLASNVERLADRFPSLPREDAFIMASLDMFHKILFGRDMTLFDGPWETNPWNVWMEKGKLMLPLIMQHGLSPAEKQPELMEQMKQLQAFINERPQNEALQTINESEKWNDKPTKPYFVKLAERGEVGEEILNGGSVSALFGAALDTTALSMEFLTYNLACHPEAQQKLYNEITSVLQGKPLTTEHLKHLPYLKACLKESYRLNPVVSHNGRLLDQEITLQGYKIPPGVLIQITSFPYCHDEKIFPDPHVFRPERWLDTKNVINELQNHPYIVLPFGIGARMCIGARVAESEMRAFMCALLSKYEFINETPVPVKLKSILTNKPDPQPIIKYKPRHR